MATRHHLTGSMCTGPTHRECLGNIISLSAFRGWIMSTRRLPQSGASCILDQVWQTSVSILYQYCCHQEARSFALKWSREDNQVCLKFCSTFRCQYSFKSYCNIRHQQNFKCKWTSLSKTSTTHAMQPHPLRCALRNNKHGMYCANTIFLIENLALSFSKI